MTKNRILRLVPLIAAAVMMIAGGAQAQAAPASIYQVLTDARPNSGGVILLSPSNLLDNPAVPRLGNVAPSTPGELQVRARNGRILAKHPIPKG